MKAYLHLFSGLKVLRTPEFTEQRIADIVSAESEATTGQIDDGPEAREIGPPWLFLSRQLTSLQSQVSIECGLYYLVGWRKKGLSVDKNLIRISLRLTNGGSSTNNNVLRSLFKTPHTSSVWFYVW